MNKNGETQNEQGKAIEGSVASRRKPLRLNRETLRALTFRELESAAGGIQGGGTPTCGPNLMFYGLKK